VPHEDMIVYVPDRRLLAGRVIFHHRVMYRRISVTLDRIVAGGLQRLNRILSRLGLSNPRRPPVSRTIFFLIFVLRVALDIRRQRCDIVHLYIFAQYAPIIRALNGRVKIVLHMHDHSQWQRDINTTLKHLQCCDAIVGCSEFITQRVRMRFPEVADRCHAIVNAVNLDRFRWMSDWPAQPGQPKRILFVGRLSPEKGIHVLMQAFEQVVKRGHDVDLCLIGPKDVAPGEFVDPLREDRMFDDLRQFYDDPGAYYRYLETLLSREAAGRVTFVGEVDHADIARHYAASDVFVFPSIWPEPFGLPVIEAMASGVPVVATQVGAFPEIVDHCVTGLLVARGDATALAGAIERLINDSDLRRELTLAAWARVGERYSWQRYVSDWLEQYRALIDERGDT